MGFITFLFKFMYIYYYIIFYIIYIKLNFVYELCQNKWFVNVDVFTVPACLFNNFVF